MSLSFSFSLLLFLQLRTIRWYWSGCGHLACMYNLQLLDLRFFVTTESDSGCVLSFMMFPSLSLFFSLQLRMITIDGRLLSYVVHDCVFSLLSMLPIPILLIFCKRSTPVLGRVSQLCQLTEPTMGVGVYGGKQKLLFYSLTVQPYSKLPFKRNIIQEYAVGFSTSLRGISFNRRSIFDRILLCRCY